MKKRLFYLAFVLTFFLAITNVFAVDIYNEGGVSGFDINSNPYSCNGVNKGVYKLKGDDGIRYYSALCSVDFPCSYNDQNENTCVGQNRYLYTETNKCYVTCDNYTGNDFGNNQHDIWDKIKLYPTGRCEADRMNAQDLQNGMNILISNNACKSDADFYVLKEYENETGSKVISVNTEIEKCEPQIKITKQCKGFSEGSFTIKVGSEEVTLSCGETSSPITVPADTPIAISELNSHGYMVYMDKKLTNGTISVGYGRTEEVIIMNSVGKAELIKTNGTNGSPMDGITFRLEKKVNGEWVRATDYKGNNIGDMTTSADGKLTFSGLLIGSYRVVEVSNSTGNYIASDTVEFTIDKDSIDENFANVLNIVNNPFKFKILKIDTTGKGLSDSVFIVEKKGTDGSFQTVSEIVIGANGEELYLEKTGYYKITEIQSPLGYDILNTPIEIEFENGYVKKTKFDSNYVSYTEENGIFALKVINDKSKVKIYKRDSATGDTVVGAKLELKQVDGTVIEEFTTGDSSFSISLAPGRYILSEITAPKGYEKLKDNFEFIVKEDGTIEGITNSVLFEVNGMNINLYNIKPTPVPDTGIGLNILLTILGISLLGGGSYIVYKNVKKTKNDK